MLRIVPNYNEMFYRCYTKENDGVKHLDCMYHSGIIQVSCVNKTKI